MTPVNNGLLLLTHSHRDGISHWLFVSDRNALAGAGASEENGPSPQLKAICQKLGINFEPHRGEFIEVEAIEPEFSGDVIAV